MTHKGITLSSRSLNGRGFLINYPKIMKKPVNSISTARAQLISKGIIYAVKYKELDFTVPEFSGFIKRLQEFQEWKKEI